MLGELNNLLIKKDKLEKEIKLCAKQIVDNIDIENYSVTEIKALRHLYHENIINFKDLSKFEYIGKQKLTQLLRKRVYITCEECGKEFEFKKSKSVYNTPTICPICEQERKEAREKEWSDYFKRVEADNEKWRERKKELSNMTYKEYLQTPEWAAIRKRAFKKAGFRCELCGSGGELHPHHKSYPERGTETKDDIIVLCRECHAHHHRVLEN